MTSNSDYEKAIEILQELGLREYEAESFVALTRTTSATAKDISTISDVPRTRVYDAVRVLESKGLVEVHHTSPQVFRAVSVDAAIDILRREYQSQTDRLQTILHRLEPIPLEEEPDVSQEVWSISGKKAIYSHINSLLNEADSEIVVLFGQEALMSDTVIQLLQDVSDTNVSLTIGITSEQTSDKLSSTLPDAEVFTSNLTWLDESYEDDSTAIGQILLVDRSKLLVSSYDQNFKQQNRQAIVGSGFSNGVVAIIRRLMLSGIQTDS